MIRLTDFDGRIIIVNPQYVVGVIPVTHSHYGINSIVKTVIGDKYEVRENVIDIMKSIEERSDETTA